MAHLGIYDINAVECSISGIPLKDGVVSFAVEPEGPAFADEAGADGSVIRYATNERRANCTVVLKGSSDENAKLSALHAGDVAVTNGLGVVPFMLKDGNGTSLIATDKAWITGMPGMTFANLPQDVTWTFRLVLSSPLQHIVGGN